MGFTSFETRALYGYLLDAPHHGVLAAQLLLYLPGLVELLFPAKEHPELNDFDRALRVQALIERAIGVIRERHEEAGEALAIILGLTKGAPVDKRTLEQRRYRASRLFGRASRKFRGNGYEKDFLFQLAVEIYRLHTAATAPR